MSSLRAALIATLVSGLCACAPWETVTTRPVFVSYVDVVVTGRCSGTSCSSSVFDRQPLRAPSSSYDGRVNRNPNNELVVRVCSFQPTTLSVYRVTRVNTDGGTETFEGLSGDSLGEATSEVNTQYGQLDAFEGYSLFHSLYEIGADGGLNFEETPTHAHDLDPISNDGGTMVFEYKPFRYVDPNGGFLNTSREEYPFTFIETHRVSSGEELFEERYSECPQGAPQPDFPDF